MDESICTRSCECRAIPSVLIAGGYVVGCVVVQGNCEMKGVRTWAIIVVCIVECVCTTLSIDDIMPSVLLAGILVIGVV